MSLRAVLALALLFALVSDPPAARAADAANGKAVFDAECAKCHGADGSGDTPAGKALKVPSMHDPRLTGPDSLETIKKVFAENPKHSSIKGKISPEELDAVAAYVKLLAAGGA
ncbi:MAG TPA: cytochrome c [Myxococcota bacterium]|jgi:mono/diheme cytochrome c family protein|nr:cytochrome c [Myxococcota bacterium]